MKPSRPLNEPDLQSFEVALQETEKDFLALSDRYRAVRQAQQQREQLQEQLTQETLPTAELKRLQRQIEELEVALESQLLSWEAVKEPFWQALRFGGLGLVIGWVLRGWAGG
jgi:predicted RNase H-like nuclease (RuvC/YqgF family)